MSSFYKFKKDRDIFEKLENENRKKDIKVNPLKTVNIVVRSTYDIVGKYNNLDICRYILLDDGRNFIFESIAVEKSPGLYHADKSDITYIIVDNCLLYREVLNT